MARERPLPALHCGATPHCHYRPCVCLCDGCWVARVIMDTLRERPGLRKPAGAAGRCARVAEQLIHQCRAHNISCDLVTYWRIEIGAGEVHVPHDLYWGGPLPKSVSKRHQYRNHCIAVVDRGDHWLHIDLTARQFNGDAPCPLLWTEPKERWRRFRVGGLVCPWYGVTEAGAVYSMRPSGKAPILLKTQPHYRTGHPRLRLYAHWGLPKPRHRSVAVHKVVADAWLPPCPEPGLLVRHLDNDSTNAHASNLAWGTPAENWQDSHRPPAPEVYAHDPNLVYIPDPVLGF